MKHVKLFEQFISEGLFRTYNHIVGYEYKKFEDGFKALNKDNVIIYDKKEDVSYGTRKGSKEAFWKYFHDEGKLYHSERDGDVLGLIHGFKIVSKNHPWSK